MTIALPAFVAAVLAWAIEPTWEPAGKTFGLYTDPAGYARLDLATLRRLFASHQLLYLRDGPTATAMTSLAEAGRFRSWGEARDRPPRGFVCSARGRAHASTGDRTSNPSPAAAGIWRRSNVR